jgi:hypothetical protein
MVAGIPGAGIGGLFYLLSALLMPIRALRGRWRAEREDGVREVRRQVLMAMAILGGIWLTGWLLGFVLVRAGVLTVPAVSATLRRLPGASHNVLKVAMVLGGFLTLAAVLFAVEAARFVFAPRARSSRIKS